MRLSFIGMDFPFVRKRASSSAHFKPVSAGEPVETPDPRLEPAFQRGWLPSLWKVENPESQFANNDGIYRAVRLMCTEPLDDTGTGEGLVGSLKLSASDQILHSASVDLHSMGTKKPFYGQAGNNSITPWFGGAARRARAIVPLIETLHIECLPRFNVVHMPEFCRQDDLAFGGDGGLHLG
jgi:hypothetical protein